MLAGGRVGRDDGPPDVDGVERDGREDLGGHRRGKSPESALRDAERTASVATTSERQLLIASMRHVLRSSRSNSLPFLQDRHR